jgi:hypothetical protein
LAHAGTYCFDVSYRLNPQRGDIKHGRSQIRTATLIGESYRLKDKRRAGSAPRKAAAA